MSKDCAMFADCFHASRSTQMAIAAAEGLGRKDFTAIVVLEHLALANLALLRQFKHLMAMEASGGID